MKESETNSIIRDLKSFFGAEAIGSYLFYNEGWINFEDLGDIDILVKTDVRDNLDNYLKSIGFDQTIKKGNQIRYERGYERGTTIWERIPVGDHKKPNYLTIDVQSSDDIKVWGLDEIVRTKFRRGKEQDFVTLKKIIDYKLSNVNHSDH